MTALWDNKKPTMRYIPQTEDTAACVVRKTDLQVLMEWAGDAAEQHSCWEGCYTDNTETCKYLAEFDIAYTRLYTARQK